MLPPLEDARKLVSGLFVELVGQITTEDSKKIRELVRNAAIRDDRKLTPRELELVAVAAEQIRAALAPLRAEQDDATGSKKGARLEAHQPRARHAAHGRRRCTPRTPSSSRRSTRRTSRRRASSATGCSPRSSPRPTDDTDVRELANDLCLRTDGKIQKEDLDALIQWALKVREMYLDIESRRADTREAAVDSVNRLEQTWQLFRELEPKMVVNDEQLFRELKDRFGSPYGFGVYFRGGMGAESIRDLLRDLDLAEESLIAARDRSAPRRARSSSARSSG